MARIEELTDLPGVAARVVIINVGTELVTTLALASAAHNARLPIVVVNCDPTEESSAHFDRLGERFDFAVLDAEIQPHGVALDRIFRDTDDELLLLLDSDAEIRDATLCDRWIDSFDVPHVFGAGYINGPKWLTERLGATPQTGLFNERPWMPCVMLRVEHVRDALDAGHSFEASCVYNDFRWSASVSEVLAGRFQNDYVPKLRGSRFIPPSYRARLQHAQLPWLAWARREYFGRRPNYVWCDTGTHVYQWCKYVREQVYAGIHVSLLDDEVAHYQGITRRRRQPDQTAPAADLSDIERDVVDRLAGYGLTAADAGIR